MKVRLYKQTVKGTLKEYQCEISAHQKMYEITIDLFSDAKICPLRDFELRVELDDSRKHRCTKIERRYLDYRAFYMTNLFESKTQITLIFARN